MPQIIEVPGMGQVSFPDGMTDADISAAIQRNTAPAPTDAISQLASSSMAADEAKRNSPSPLGSFFREGGRSVLPGAAGFLGGAAAGAGVGALGGPFAPITVPVAALVGGLTTGMATRKVQDMAADAIAPNSFAGTASATQDYQTNPLSTLLGGTLATGRPAPFRAAGAIKTLATQEGRGLLSQAIQKGAPAVAKTALDDVVDVAAGAGIGAGMSLATGDGMALENAGVGLLFNRGYFGGRQSLSTDTQHGVQGDPATGLPVTAGVVPIETNAAVGNPSRAFDIMESNALANRLKTGQPLETVETGPNYAPLPFVGGPEVRGPMVQGPVVNGPRVQGPIIEGPRGPVVGEAPPREVWQGPRPIESAAVRGPVVNGPSPLGPRGPVVDGPVPIRQRAFTDTPPPEVKLGQQFFTDTALPVEPTPIPANEPNPQGLAPAEVIPQAQVPVRPVPVGETPPAVIEPARSIPQAPEPPQAQAETPVAPVGVNETPVGEPQAALTRTGETQTPVVPEPAAPPSPLKGSIALANGRLTEHRKQLAKLEAAGKGDTPQAVKRRASIDTLAAQIEAAGPAPDSRARQLQKRVSEVHDSGEFEIINRIRQNGGFAPQDRAAGLIEQNAKRGAKLSDASRKTKDGFGETRDDAARPGDFPDTPAGQLAAETLRSLHNKSPNALTVDKLAEAMGVTVPEFHAKLNAELDSIHRHNGPKANAVEETYARQERQLVDFEKAVEEAPASTKATPDELGLEKGDTLEIDGEPLRVVAATDETVTLRDHDKFGDQVVSNDTPIPADNLNSQAKARIAEEAPDAIAADEALTARQAAEYATENAAKPTPADDFALKPHESDAEIKAEKAAAKQREELAKRQSAPLKGSAGDLTPDIFGEGDTPLFNERRDKSSSMLAGLKAHRANVDQSIKDGRGNVSMTMMGVTAGDVQRIYRLGLDVAITTLEAGHAIGKAVKDGIAHIRTLAPRLTDAEAAIIERELRAASNSTMENVRTRDQQFAVELPKIAQELAATGKPVTMGDVTAAMIKKWPEQAAYIRANGQKFFDEHIFAKQQIQPNETANQREWREYHSDLMDDGLSLLKRMRNGTPFHDLGRVFSYIHNTFMTGIDANARAIYDGKIYGSESKAAKDLLEPLIGLAKGKAGLHFRSVGERMDNHVKEISNEKSDIFKAMNPHLSKLTPAERVAFRERIIDHVTDASRDGELASQPELKAAVDAVSGIRRKLHKLMTDAGADVGDVGDRTMGRIYDTKKVLDNPKEFIDGAAKAYRSKWAKEISTLNAEAASLSPLKDAKRLSAIRDEIKEIGKRDAIKTATQHQFAVAAEAIGFSHNGNDLLAGDHKGNPSILKSREFGADADQLLGKFYIRDPEVLLSGEILKAVRAAGIAEVLASPALDAQGNPKANGEMNQIGKLDAAKKAMIEEGNAEMIPHVEAVLKDYFNLGGNDGPRVRKMLEYAHTHTQLFTLAKAMLSSLPEPILIAGRSGQMKNYLTVFPSVFKEMGSILRGGNSTEHAALAYGIGEAVSSTDALLTSLKFLDPYSAQKGGKMVANFHRNTMLMQFTNATHVVAVKVGESYIGTQLQLAGAGGKFKNVAAYYLNELGIAGKDVPAMLKFHEKYSKLTKGADKIAMMRDGSPEGAAFENALHLWKTSGSSLEVNRGTRPRYANHPLGQMFGALKGFIFAFQKAIIGRQYQLLKAATKGEMVIDGVATKLDTAERAKIYGDLAMMIAGIGVAQAGVQQIRNTIFADPAQKAKDDALTGEQRLRKMGGHVLTRANLLGAYDIPLNLIFNIKYDQDPGRFILGPSGSLLSTGISQGVGLWGDKNSPNTTTAERQFARTIFDGVLKPAANGFVAGMPGGLPATVLTQLASHNRTREAFVAGVAGKPTPQGGTTKKTSTYR